MHDLCIVGPYRIPNIRLSSSALVTNKTPTGTYRAPGRYEGSFFCERLIEPAAKELAIDSVEMRRRNLVADAEMPYPLARVEPGDLYAQTECDSGDYAHALERCLTEFGWEEKRKLQGRLIDGRYLRGIAIGRRAWLFAGSDQGGERAAATPAVRLRWPERVRVPHC